MAADKTTPPNDEVVAVSDEALQKAESFVEAEEGAANRLMGMGGQNLDHDCGARYSDGAEALSGRKFTMTAVCRRPRSFFC